MAGIVRQLQFADGITVDPPTDVGIETSTSTLQVYADDAAYELANGPSTEGDIYINSTSGNVRFFEGGGWTNSVPDADPSAKTKRWRIEWSAFGSAATASFAPSGSVSLTATFPGSGTVLYRDDAATVNNKFLSGGAATNAVGWTVPKGAKSVISALTRVEGMVTYATDEKAYYGDDGAQLVSLGGGGGGGGSAVWSPVEGSEPVASQENGEKVYLFPDGGTEKLCLFVKVPEGYVAGKQVNCYISLYSPSSSNTIKLQTTAYLVRKNTDAVSSTTNSRASTNSALTNTVANMYRQAVLDLSSSTGTINSVAIAAGDLIRVELTRDSATDTDTAAIRFLPSGTELKFT